MKRKGKTVTILAGTGGIIVVALLGFYWRDFGEWYKFRCMFDYLGENEQGDPEYRHKQTGIVMVRRPGIVTLEPFLISKGWVTAAQAQLERCCLSTSEGDFFPQKECEEWCKRNGLTFPNREWCKRNGLTFPNSDQWDAQFVRTMLDGAPPGNLLVPLRPTYHPLPRLETLLGF